MTDAERIRQLEIGNTKLNQECIAQRERIKQLEAENSKMMNVIFLDQEAMQKAELALIEFKKIEAENLNMLECFLQLEKHCLCRMNKDRTGIEQCSRCEKIKAAKKVFPHTSQLAREREAQLEVCEWANHVSEKYNLYRFISETSPEKKLFDALVKLNLIYQERKNT